MLRITDLKGLQNKTTISLVLTNLALYARHLSRTTTDLRLLAGDSCKRFNSLMTSKRTPPPFLGRRKISNEFFTRHDSIGLAEDSIALNIVWNQEQRTEPVLVAIKRLRDKSNSQNDNKLVNDSTGC